MQLSHSGRQMDLPGIHNQHRPTLSSTSRKEPLHGFLCQAMTKADIARTVAAFARGAWRAREAGLDGVELHAANGYLFTQFLSSGINDRTDEYGGSLANRARFLLEVIAAIRDSGRPRLPPAGQAQRHRAQQRHPVGGQGQHAGGHAAGRQDGARHAGVDALHVSTGSLFPHPLNPPGDLPIDVLAATYDALISSGVYGFRNFLLFRYPLLRPIFRWIWFRMKKGLPFEAISIEEARAIKAAVSIPVINTGGYQTASVVREGITVGRLRRGRDRPLADRQSRPHRAVAGRRATSPAMPCTYCNKCLVNAPENPMGCYEQARFPSREAMIEQLMSIYRAKPELAIPLGGGGLDDERTGHGGRGLASAAQLAGQFARRAVLVLLLVLFLAALIVGDLSAQAHFGQQHAALRRHRRALQIRLDRRRAE